MVPMRLVQECSRDRGARRVVILDACRSGVDPREKGQTTSENQLASKDIQAVTATSPTSSPLIVVCSCQPRQRSYEHGGLRGGLFTAAMLGEFSRLRTGGRPIRFTTETNSAISQRMKRLAVEIKMTPTEIGDFWIEGDATGVELVPATRAQSAPAAPRPSAPDPEKEEVKEWVIEELHVELERVEAEQAAAPTDLPPVPESVTTLRAELAGLEKTLARLKAHDHPSLQQAQAAVREAELQLQTFQEDLAAHELPLPDNVREKLAKAVEADSSAQASTFCVRRSLLFWR